MRGISVSLSSSGGLGPGQPLFRWDYQFEPAPKIPFAEEVPPPGSRLDPRCKSPGPVLGAWAVPVWLGGSKQTQ